MAKRELIDKKKLIRDVKESNAIDFAERMKFSNVVEHQKPITEKEIVKPYLRKLKEKVQYTPKLYPYIDHIDSYIKTDDVLSLIDNLLFEKGTEK